MKSTCNLICLHPVPAGSHPGSSLQASEWFVSPRGAGEDAAVCLKRTKQNGLSGGRGGTMWPATYQKRWTSSSSFHDWLFKGWCVAVLGVV